MSAPELPDNPARWPADPYELLGVAPGVGRVELRRAYARLIRRFKPEHHAEAFRRIREAYETLEARVRWREAAGDTGDERVAAHAAGVSWDIPRRTGPAAEIDESHASHDAETTGNRAALGSRNRSVDHVVRGAWRTAQEGDIAAAYDELRSLLARHPGDEDVCLRLYWLATLAPRVDAERDPCRWLLQGMQRTGPGGRLAEVYRQELESNPHEARSERAGQLLDRPAAASQLYALASARWRGASGELRGCRELIAGDLDRLRPRLSEEFSELWLRLVLLALDYIIWTFACSQDELVQRLLGEFDRFQHLNLSLAEQLGRLDLLLELANAWNELRMKRDVPPQLIELIPQSWFRPVHEIRSELLDLLGRWVADPMAGVRELRRIDSVTLNHLDGVIRSLAWMPRRNLESADACLRTRRIRDFLIVQEWNPYSTTRLRLLAFCAVEDLCLEDVLDAVHHAAPHEVKSIRDYLQHLNVIGLLDKDLSLRLMCRAQQIFARL